MKCTKEYLCKLIKQEPGEVSAEYIHCTDGLRMSVQAGSFHYSRPRDSTGPWEKVEVGYPNREIPEFSQWADDNDKPPSVYGYVPIHVVIDVINAAGGLDEAYLV